LKVAVAGTFQRFHRAHEILLGVAASRPGKLLVGVTTTEFAQKFKPYRVRPYEERAERVREFLRGLKEDFEIIPLEDRYGPAVADPDIGVLVVSPETYRVGKEINALRRAAGLRPMELVRIPLILEEGGLPLSSRMLEWGLVDREGRRLRPVRVAVASDNPVKVRSVRRAFSRFLRGIDVELLERPVDTGIPPEPVGEEVMAGALLRAAKALGDVDYSVGPEAGLVRLAGSDLWVDVQVTAIADRIGYVTLGSSPGFEYPRAVTIKALKGKEVGSIMKEKLGYEVSRAEGAIGFYSMGLMDRVEFSEKSVLMALVPRISAQEYFPWRRLNSVLKRIKGPATIAKT